MAKRLTDLEKGGLRTKWNWKMAYCLENHLPPAEVWAWELAEVAYWEMNDEIIVDKNRKKC